MKLAYQGRYNEHVRDSYKGIIFANIVQSMQSVPCPFHHAIFLLTGRPSVVLDAMLQLDLALQPDNEMQKFAIIALSPEIKIDAFPRDVADAIRGLWSDPGVKEAVQRSRSFKLNDSAGYYFNAIDRISAKGYMPTDEDIMRSWVLKPGITETTFKLGDLTYRLLDVSCERSTPVKWLHCFEGITALVFVVSIAEYDQFLYEDQATVSFFSSEF